MPDPVTPIGTGPPPSALRAGAQRTKPATAAATGPRVGFRIDRVESQEDLQPAVDTLVQPTFLTSPTAAAEPTPPVDVQSASLGSLNATQQSRAAQQPLPTTRRRRRKKGGSRRKLLPLQQPANLEGKYNPMLLFCRGLVKAGLPTLSVPGVSLPYTVYSVTPDCTDAVPTSPRTVEDDGAAEEWGKRFATFYRRHNPGKVDTVDRMLRAAASRGTDPATLWAMLLSKYELSEETWRDAGLFTGGADAEAKQQDAADTDDDVQSPRAPTLPLANEPAWSARIEAFYLLHDPLKASKAREMLAEQLVQGTPPEAVWRATLKKYGFAEDTWARDEETSDSYAAWAALLQRFYGLFDPQKAEDSSEVFRGMRQRGVAADDVWRAIVKSYNVTEDTWHLGPDAAKSIDWEARFRMFYSIHAPERVSTVPVLLREVRRRGAEPLDLWVRVLDKYGVTEENWSGTASATRSGQGLWGVFKATLHAANAFKSSVASPASLARTPTGAPRLDF
eukprot:TRINITY_DN4492_c1_g2_i1.p1 TRINITY_DN4492_c1_g2~~TRINITY_DN4492_c1_g2_i1.p1  ORF type:complete len:505 (+),score=113.55 TRINITY_DN4492_c1_g2_i1:59-1573(+)